MQTILNFVDGRHVEPAGGRFFDKINPATGEVIARVPDSDEHDIELAVAAALNAFPAWSGLPAAVIDGRKVGVGAAGLRTAAWAARGTRVAWVVGHAGVLSVGTAWRARRRVARVRGVPLPLPGVARSAHVVDCSPSGRQVAAGRPVWLCPRGVRQY